MHSPASATEVAAFTFLLRVTCKTWQALRLLLAVGATLAGGLIELRAQSALDGFDPNANNLVLAVVLQPDGKILLGGSFTTLSPNGGAAVTRNRIARLNPDGTLDSAFNPNANSDVNAIALQADGKILVGGFFTTLSPNGGAAVTRNRIARLNPDGTLDPTFDPNASGSVRALALQADGKILVGGQFATIGGATRNRLARLDPATGTADSFDPNANNTVFAIAVQPDGKILAGGNFNGTNSIGGQTRNRLARLDPGTGLADTFNPSASGAVVTLALQADGKILAGGSFNGANSIGGQARNRIARLDPATGLAEGFNPNANFQVSAIVVQPDGRILVGGDFNGANSIGGAARNNIARLDPISGAADSFDPKASNQASVFAVAVQRDGKVLVGGNFSTIAANGAAAVTRNNIARLETDGRLDRTLNLSVVGTQIRALAVQPDGKILIGGIFSSVQGVTRNRIARFNADGSLDMAFNPNANGLFGVQAIAVQADGKIIVGGDFNGFNNIGGQSRNRIARLDPTTGAADSWNPNANGEVSAIVVQPDGKILVGGSFSFFGSIGGQNRNGIARLDPTTGQADSFDPDANSSVIALALQTDGKVLAGGRFTEIGGQPRNLFARLDGTTGQADSFNPAPNDLVLAFAVQADGKIVVVGGFSSIGGQPRRGVARLDPVTGLADTFDPSISGQVTAIALQSDGKILAGGGFSSVGTAMRRNLVRLDPTTGAADSFDPNATESVLALAVQADGKVLAGGFFSAIGGQPHNLFARLGNDTAALQDLLVTQNSITWTRGGSSTQFGRVHFESSTDNIAYTPIGHATRSGSNWTLTGLNLPLGENLYIRSRGYYGTGVFAGSESVQETVRNVFLLPTTTLANISTRARVGVGDNVVIGGFIVRGTGQKRVLIRAIGPSLAAFGVPNVLLNPRLQVFSGQNEIAANDDWQNSPQAQEIMDTTVQPTHSAEAAVIVSPAEGNYTAIVSGVGNAVGAGLVEVYDLEPQAPARLQNISTRAVVGVGDDVMIGGLIVRGAGTQKVVVRGIGPSLTAFGVQGALANPSLRVVDGNGQTVATNDDWASGAGAAELMTLNIAPTQAAEAALVVNLAPGPYTAIVSGEGATTGVGLVEIYKID